MRGLSFAERRRRAIEQPTGDREKRLTAAAQRLVEGAGDPRETVSRSEHEAVVQQLNALTELVQELRAKAIPSAADDEQRTREDAGARVVAMLGDAAELTEDERKAIEAEWG